VAENGASPAVRIREWSEEEFGASSSEWQQLLDRSRADPLFMSWDWQWRWWTCHRQLLGAKLRVLAAYLPDGTLVGIAPFYLRQVRHKPGIPARRLELLGQAWRNRKTVFSEYLDIIVAREATEGVLEAFARALLADAQWGDLVFGNIREDSSAAQLASRYLARRGYLRWVDPLEAHATLVDGTFESYLQRIDASIRRKLFNHRKKLVNPTLTFASESDVGAYLDRIDAFHIERWGVAHYTGLRREFHAGLAAAMAKRGALRMSVLNHGGEPFSALYNIRLQGTEYNLQAGFSGKASGVSPGYLHLGYALEQVYTDGLKSLDFLAGEGRNRQYKADFQTSASSVATLQVVRNLPLRALYGAHDVVSSWRERSRAPEPVAT
jgi:CelD/BcsL family acetyltransferase involved in cellulose biosynthesis